MSTLQAGSATSIRGDDSALLVHKPERLQSGILERPLGGTTQLSDRKSHQGVEPELSDRGPKRIGLA
jgi:hypothetical protein